MRYNYKGFRGCDSSCDIEVHRRSDGKYVFIATEVPDNPGISVTNCAEHLATAMRNFLLLVLATLAGIGAFGLTQADAAITAKEGPTVILIMVGCIALFGGASFISASASTRGQSTIVKVRRTLFLIGVCGAIAVLFFAIISGGRIFQFGVVPTVLLAFFVLMALSSRLEQWVK